MPNYTNTWNHETTSIFTEKKSGKYSSTKETKSRKCPAVTSPTGKKEIIVWAPLTVVVDERNCLFLQRVPKTRLRQYKAIFQPARAPLRQQQKKKLNRVLFSGNWKLLFIELENPPEFSCQFLAMPGPGRMIERNLFCLGNSKGKLGK